MSFYVLKKIYKMQVSGQNFWLVYLDLMKIVPSWYNLKDKTIAASGQFLLYMTISAKLKIFSFNVL